MKKTLSFYLSVIGVVAAIAALVMYLMSGKTMNYVIAMNAIGIVAGVAYLAMYGKSAGQFWHPYLLAVAGVLILGAFGYSFIVEAELLGYLVSGLRQWSDIQMWAYFGVASVVSWLVLLIASFGKTPVQE